MTEPFSVKASPKTLKQQIKNLYKVCDEEGLIPNEIDIINTVKEWLTQKRQEVAHQSDLCDDCRAQRRLLDNLLEELNQ